MQIAEKQLPIVQLHDENFLLCNLQDSSELLCNLQDISLLLYKLQYSNLLSSNLEDSSYEKVFWKCEEKLQENIHGKMCFEKRRVGIQIRLWQRCSSTFVVYFHNAFL